MCVAAWVYHTPMLQWQARCKSMACGARTHSSLHKQHKPMQYTLHSRIPPAEARGPDKHGTKQYHDTQHDPFQCKSGEIPITLPPTHPLQIKTYPQHSGVQKPHTCTEGGQNAGRGTRRGLKPERRWQFVTTLKSQNQDGGQGTRRGLAPFSKKMRGMMVEIRLLLPASRYFLT